MKKVVITGATGFVGSNLVKYLIDKNFEIGIIIRKDSDLSILDSVFEKLTVFQYNYDLDDLIVFFKEFKPNLVFHLASKFIAEHKSNQIDDLVSSNISFGLNILEAMRISGVNKLVNTGTSWQHYNNDSYNPVCLYAATKQSFESLLEYYIQAENFTAITLKLFDTYGENDKRPKLINLLHKYCDENIELNMSMGNQLLNLVHVNDVCKAYLLSYNIINSDENKNSHQIYSVKSENNYSLKQVIELFKKVTNKQIKVNWGGRPNRKREVMKLWDKGKNLPNWIADISLAEGLKKYE